jgi:type III secretion protein J
VRPLPAIFLLSLVAGCTSPIAHALDEADANRVLVALDRAGIGGEKDVDPAAEGRFRVLVERDEAPHALAVLRDEDLPGSHTTGMLDALGKGSLIPSQLAERAQFITGLGGELERTLSAIDGVLSARVHLSLPENEPLREGPRPKATASVLMKHRGSTSPIDAQEVKRLVAGAAPGLLLDDVAVVMVPRAQPASFAERGLTHLGPITATRGSVGLLRSLAAAVVAINVALVAAVLALWSRVRKLRAEALDDASPQPARRV